MKPTKGQIDDLMDQIDERVTKGDRVLVTTLTKKMAEDLTDYLLELGVRVRYLHSEVDTIQRIEILRGLRLGEFDVLVGINLLREGLDLPEVSLVAILDADKEGFLRSQTSLIQTMGRAARNVDGQVIMYADSVTDSMQRAISETNRRRRRQEEYNAEHGINPQTIRKAVTDILSLLRPDEGAPVPGKDRRSRTRDQRRVAAELAELPQHELGRLIQTLEEEMHEAVGRPALRVRRPAAGRDQGPEARAARSGLTCRRPSRWRRSSAAFADEPGSAPSTTGSRRRSPTSRGCASWSHGPARARPGRSCCSPPCTGCVLDHPDEELAAWYPTVTGGTCPRPIPVPAFLAFCRKHEAALTELVETRSTQTNEVNRSVAVAAALRAAVADRPDTPVALVELGPSAGLNLHADTYAIETDDGVVHQDAVVARPAAVTPGRSRPARLRRAAAADRRPGRPRPAPDRRPHRRRRRGLAGSLPLARAARPLRAVPGRGRPARRPTRPSSSRVTCSTTCPRCSTACPTEPTPSCSTAGCSPTSPRPAGPGWPRSSAGRPPPPGQLVLGRGDRAWCQEVEGPPTEDAGLTVLGLTTFRDGDERTTCLGTSHPHLAWLDWQA